MARRKRRQNPDKMTLFLLAGVGVAGYFAYKGWKGSQEEIEGDFDTDYEEMGPTAAMVDAMVADGIKAHMDRLGQEQPVQKGMIKKRISTLDHNISSLMPDRSFLTGS